MKLHFCKNETGNIQVHKKYLYHNSDLDYQDSLMYEYVHQHKLAPYIYLLGFIMVAKIHFLD